jgi:uncharacterized protein with HEPN domain
MPRDWVLRVTDILEAIERIEHYTEDMTETEFEGDPKTRDATFYNLQVIGEATSHIPEDVASRYSEVPWIDIRGMRNVIAHGYFAVKLPIVWKTVSEDLRPLKTVPREILDSHPDEGD